MWVQNGNMSNKWWRNIHVLVEEAKRGDRVAITPRGRIFQYQWAVVRKDKSCGYYTESIRKDSTGREIR